MKRRSALVVALFGAVALSGCMHDIPPPPQGPEARFDHECDLFTCDFDATASEAGDAPIASYAWDFAGLAAADGPTAQFTFTDAGTFIVRLNVTDEDGLHDTRAATLTVPVDEDTPSGPNAMTASFTHTCDGLVCTFDASGSTPGDDPIEEYRWDFGPVAPSRSGVTTTLEFPEPGTYTVALEITDEAGQRASAVRDIDVMEEPTTELKADFEFHCQGLACLFDGSVSTPGESPIESHWWDFGSVAPARSGETTSEEFPSAGTYTVGLEVTDMDGEMDRVEKDVTVTGGTGDCDGATPPGQQEKASVGELECPGEYAMVDEGDGDSLDRPDWETGYWWDYDLTPPICTDIRFSVEGEETVSSEDPPWEMDVFRYRQTATCDGNTDSSDLFLTQDHLNEIHVSGTHAGAIEHDLLFPLRDGKTWVYVQEFGGLSEAEVEHLGFHFGYSNVWRITVVADVFGDEVEFVYYLDETVGWHVRMEINDGSGPPIVLELRDWHGDDDPLP